MKTNIKQPVLIFIGAVFVLSIAIIVLRGIKIPQIPYLTEKKTKTEVQPKMSELKAQDGKIMIKYSQLDLFMTECCGTVVKEVKSEKNNDLVSIKGRATFPFSADFSGKIKPFIENEKLKFGLTDIVLGKVESPKILTDKLNSLIGVSLDEKINGKYKAKDVKIKGEGIEITIN